MDSAVTSPGCTAAGGQSERAVDAARSAQSRWRAVPIRERLRVVRALRRSLAREPEAFVDALEVEDQKTRSEALASEVLPLADACRFLEREAPTILATRRPGRRGRPAWLGAIDLEIRREPLGVVLVLGPRNYPLLLPGVQAVQAIVAGNAVLWKPGRGGGTAARLVLTRLHRAGLPDHLLQVLDEDDEAGRRAIHAGVDRVVLTGSAETGTRVLSDLAERIVPATVELSGCDAVFVLNGADPERIADAVAFGLRLNGGATCIAPRRVFARADVADALATRIAARCRALGPVLLDAEAADRLSQALDEAVTDGAVILCGGREGSGDRFRPVVLAGADPSMRLLREDHFAPVVSVVSVRCIEDALRADSLCPFALGASVFGPEAEARAIAGRVCAGVVVVNDLIVPTADPRLPFGGRGRSGFGVTRGAEGLLEMTAPKAVSVRRGGRMPHLDAPGPRDETVLRALLALGHAGGLRLRITAAATLAREAWSRVRRKGR